jgi:hypothetical protein
VPEQPSGQQAAASISALAEAIRQQLTAHFVSSAEEVLRLALSTGSTIAPSQSS